MHGKSQAGCRCGRDRRYRAPLSLPASGISFARSLETSLAGWTIAWSPSLGLGGDYVDPEVLDICEPAISALVDLGATVIEATPGWLLTYPFNMTSTASTTVPAGFTASGLPVGLQLSGGHRSNLAVLQASAAFESARPWRQTIPDMAG